MMIDSTNFFPQVLQAVPSLSSSASDKYKVYAYFNDGSVRCFDAAPLIKHGTVFQPLADINVFRSAMTVLNNTVAWDLSGKRDEYDCIDLDPEALFACPEVPDPLDERHSVN